MGKVTGFLEIDRADRRYAPASDRIRHYREFMIPLCEEATRNQAARCMNCGIPYCHTGCPVNNQIPDWNDLVYRGDWQERAQPALDQQFPGIHRPRLSRAVRGILHAQHRGYAGHDQDDRMRDRRPRLGRRLDRAGAADRKTGKKVAVIGSGPAGIACAQQLARAGHEVHVFEKNAKAGGLLRYGIPDFKMEKHPIDRRVEQMEAEGVIFHYGAHVGDRSARRLARRAMMRWCCPAAPRSRATCRFPAASSRRSLRDGLPAAAEPARVAASRSARASRSSPAASMSS